MKTKILLSAIFILFITSLALPQNFMLNGTSIDSYISDMMKRWEIPGMSVAIVKGNDVIFAKGYGVRELGKSAPVNENTLFAIASNSKAFTGTAIALLDYEKKLSLDDKIIKYFPDFKLYDDKWSQEATIKDVLTHRIGLGTFEGDFVTWGTTFSRTELISKIRFVKPEYNFRDGYGYCNTGYLIGGEIVRIVSGESYDDFIKDKFFKPLEMTRTISSVSDLKNFDNVAAPHTYNYDNKMVPISWRNVDNLAPAGGIISSASDMAKWVILQLNEGKYKGEQIVPKAALLETQTPYNALQIPTRGIPSQTKRHFLTYGFGWFMGDYKGKLYLEHSGGYDGMVSRVAFMPDENFGLVILTNNDQNNAITTLMYQIFDEMTHSETINWDSTNFARSLPSIEQNKSAWNEIMLRKNTSIAPSFAMSNLTGTYSSEQAGKLFISEKNGKYILTLECRPDMEITLDNFCGDTLTATSNDYVLGRSLAPVKVTGSKVSSISIRVSDFVDPLYYEFLKKD
jgi:CubicO group peptidase (beta-lactamase class C family)